MPYEIRYDAKTDCVYSCYEGEIDKQMAEEYAVEIIKVLREHSCLRSLNDMRKAKVKLSTMEIYEYPIYLEQLGYERLVKRALVVSQDLVPSISRYGKGEGMAGDRNNT
ncbi:MAG: hypothetical protein ACYSUK_12085 [Planctomycetota bacterium]